MPKNRYQRRRTLREPTFPLSNNTEPFQGATQTPTNQSTDLGREDARQLRENKNPNTRFIDKPEATRNTQALRDAIARQEAMQRNARRQVFGERVVPHVKPQGKFSAPSVPPSPLVFKGGGVHYQPTTRGSVLTTAVGVVTEAIPQVFPEQTQAVGDWIWDNTLGWVLNETFGTNTKIGDARRNVQQFEQYKQQVAVQDAENERIYQQRVKDAEVPIREGEAPPPPTLPLPTPECSTAAPKPYPKHSGSYAQSTPSQRHFEGAPITHSPEVDLNREYKIRRDALGDNPSKEDMDAVRDYGLEQHRENFPDLYAQYYS